MLAERGLDLSYETVRRWVCKFGPLFARDLRRRRPRPTAPWHLNEMLNTIAGKRHWLWRAVDDEGEVLDVLGRRDGAAVRLMRKLIRKHGFAPEMITTDGLGSYGSAKRQLGLLASHERRQRLDPVGAAQRHAEAVRLAPRPVLRRWCLRPSCSCGVPTATMIAIRLVSVVSHGEGILQLDEAATRMH